MNNKKRIFLQIASIVVAIVSVLHLRPLIVDQNEGIDIRDIVEEIDYHHEKGKIVTLDYLNHDQWPKIAAILFRLQQQGVSACTTWQHMGFLYTDEKICDTDVSPDFVIVPPESCAENCLVVSGGVGLLVPRS